MLLYSIGSYAAWWPQALHGCAALSTDVQETAPCGLFSVETKIRPLSDDNQAILGYYYHATRDRNDYRLQVKGTTVWGAQCAY